MSSFLNFLCYLLFLSCFHAGNIQALDLTEAQQIAAEYSGELLLPPSENLVQRIEKDLQAIRSQYPNLVAGVTHTDKMSPGELIISGIKKETLDTLNHSKYGPVDAKPIFQDIIYLLTFSKPYNPKKLAELLKQDLGIDAMPNDGIGYSSKITMTSDPSGINTYVFYKGSGDCPAGCINKRYITFTIDPAQSVQLVNDTGK